MKKFLFALLAVVAVAAACNPEDAKNSPAVSFETALPVISDASATFKIVTQNYTGSEAVSIPVVFGGDAVKGVDYSVSAEAFVVGGENPVTSITVTSLTYGSGKTVTATLEPPTGWTGGTHMTSEYALAGKMGYLSFERNSLYMTDMVVATVNLFDENGQPLALVNGDEIAIEVDTEKSTAVEGTDFKFAGKKSVTIEPGAQSGSVTLELIGEEVAAGHETIVLKVVTGAKYDLGQYEKTNITIAGSEWKKFEGKWVLHQFITDAAYIQENMWLSDDDMKGFPAAAEGDAFTFDVTNGMIIPEFTSDFKNFFIGDSNFKKIDPLTLTAGMGDKRTIQMLELDNTNRNFSATSQSEDKVSQIGARIITDEETGEELLDLYLVDYKATDFLLIYLDYGMYNETKPMATTTFVFLNLTFKKAE